MVVGRPHAKIIFKAFSAKLHNGPLRPRMQHPREVVVAQVASNPRKECSTAGIQASSSSHSPVPSLLPIIDFSGPALTAFCAVVSTALVTPAALAAEGVTYNPEAGSETLKTVAGVGYIILVLIYFVRLFKKRADRATSVRISSSSDSTAEEGSDDEDEEEEVLAAAAAASQDDVTPWQCLM